MFKQRVSSYFCRFLKISFFFAHQGYLLTFGLNIFETWHACFQGYLWDIEPIIQSVTLMIIYEFGTLPANFYIKTKQTRFRCLRLKLINLLCLLMIHCFYRWSVKNGAKYQSSTLFLHCDILAQPQTSFVTEKKNPYKLHIFCLFDVLGQSN